MANTFPEFKSIFDLLKAFPDEQTCISHLEALRWNGNVVSPFDATSKVYKCAGNKYKCKNTGKYFNVRTNTIFDNTKVPLQKWFMAHYIFSSHKKGISSHQLAKDISVTQKSAWFILHRLRNAYDHPKYKEAVKGVAEVDETFVGGEGINKHKNKRVYKADDSKNAHNTKVAVLGILQRGGHVQATVLAARNMMLIRPLIEKSVPAKSILITDDWQAYRRFKQTHFHFSVNHSAKQYVDGMAHTNGIENFWSHMQRGITGIYHSVTFKHLQSYVNEYALRYNTRKDNTAQRFNLTLSNIDGKKLTYKILTKK